MKIAKAFSILVVTAAMSGAGAITAAPAFAMPQNCSTYVFTGSYGQSYCEYGSGSHRVRVSCARPGQQNYTVYGPWVGTGSVSRASCNARSASVQVQGD